MINLEPYSATLLALTALIIAGMGLYFIFLRPSLLPEDLNYMRSTLRNVNDNIPRLLNWLQRVFWVMGGFIFTTGLLTVVISCTSFRKRTSGAFYIAAVTGIASIGLMSVINFMNESDFKWRLLILSLPWLITLTFYRFHKLKRNRNGT